MSKKDKVTKPPGLENISALFPPSAPSLPSPVGNVSMKDHSFLLECLLKVPKSSSKFHVFWDSL